MTERKTIEDFYAQLASAYDTFTEWEKRWTREQHFFQSLINLYNITSAIDAGCGTGFHSLLLSHLGVNVVAADLSKEMLHITERNAKKYCTPLTIVQSSFQELSQNIPQPVDAVFCLGNSFPHCLSKKEQQRAIQNFFSVLKPNGVLILQLLNYERILQQHARIQNVKQIGEKTFVRFYDFLNSTIRFNILTLEERNKEMYHTLSSVELYPMRKKEIIQMLADASFAAKKCFCDIQCFGSVALEEYQEMTSKDLVVLAKK
jgi:ubiquinone/menaquinone biosynthesis C-methylase UbiE